MEYKCVYEITGDFHWYRLSIVLIAFVFIMVLGYEINIWKKDEKIEKWRKIFFGVIILPFFVLSFGTVLMSSGVRIFYKDPKYVLEAYRHGEYLTVEGNAEGVYWGKSLFGAKDIFYVNDVYFRTASFERQEIGYGNASRGDYIEEGKHVKIGYIPYDGRNV